MSSRVSVSSSKWLPWGVITCLLFVTGMLASCSDMSGKPLRVGINPWPGYALLFVAREKGYFAEEGVDVELVELTSLSDVRTAFERGLVDGMASSLVEVLEATQTSDRQAVICLVADYSNGADVILADQSFSDVQSLVGHKIGIEPGTLNRFILMRALARHNVDIDDVEIVSVSQNSMGSALSLGEVDAVVTYPPVSTEVGRQGGVATLFTSAEIPGEISDVISFDAEIAVSRRNEIDALSRAWGRAVAFAMEHPQEAYAMISPHTGMTVEELETAFTEIRIVTGEEQEDFMKVDGPIADGIGTLRALLWPGEDASEFDVSAFFVAQQRSSSWAAGWN